MGSTQKKGNLGLVKTITDLTEKDIAISLPISESEKYDLIAEKNNICKTVQVRYTKIYKGVMEVKLRGIWTNGEGYQTRKRKQEDYDILAVYCPDTDGVYYIDSNKFDCNSAITLRIDKPQVKNSKIRMADDYRNCEHIFG